MRGKQGKGMKSILVEGNGEEKKAYNSILVDPKSLSILNNALSLKIVQELAKNPGCAIDIARSLGEHEQKIYYHIRKLEGAGIIKFLRHEKRFGMTAKIFEAVSPVVATKLYDDGFAYKKSDTKDIEITRFLHPFIENGKLNALTIVGDTYSHGEYDMHSTEGTHAFDLAFLLGHHVNEVVFPNYKFDTEVTKEDLKNNIILIGHPQTNIILNKINTSLPFFFNEKDDWAIESKDSKVKIRDPRCGAIIKMNNPFDSSKKILILAGRTRGTRSAILAFTKFIDRLLKKIGEKDTFHILVQGYDSTGNKIIDEIKFVE